MPIFLNMRNTLKLIATLACSLLGITAWAEAIPLYTENPDTSKWTGTERTYFSDLFDTDVVTNVSIPTLTPVLPTPELATGRGVIIAPGGGFHALSINSEGFDVARWLAAKGVAAFVLRYRLVPSGEDGVREMFQKGQSASRKAMGEMAPLAGADGLAALRLVRQRAQEYGVEPDRVGFMGFSAGGAVTVHVAYKHDADSRPAFVAPVYVANRWLADYPLPEQLPPAFILAATDDPLGLASHSVALYQRWLGAKAPVELHMYATGGHGFGMKTQNLPSDQWIELFWDWLQLQP